MPCAECQIQTLSLYLQQMTDNPAVSDPKLNHTTVKGLIHILNSNEIIKNNFFPLSLQPLPVPLFIAGGQLAFLLLPPSALECVQHFFFENWIYTYLLYSTLQCF